MAILFQNSPHLTMNCVTLLESAKGKGFSFNDVSISFSWERFLDLKNICDFLLPQLGAVSLDLFPHLGQVQVQVFSEVIQAFFSTLIKLLVLHDLDQLLQQLEVGSLVSLFLFPDTALAVGHADTDEVDPLEWRRKCCFVGQELGLKYEYF